MHKSRVSIVVPTLNESAVLEPLLRRLRSTTAEIIVVDGGSGDESLAIAGTLAHRVLQTEPGRARQMNAGAQQASGKWLWFVHADTGFLAPPEDYLAAITVAEEWGFFPLTLSGARPAFRVIERFINWRSRTTQVATGDQGLFVRREVFQRLGGFVEQPLMEDVELAKRLRKLSPPTVGTYSLVTSSRRWEQSGVCATVLLMWRLRLLYFLGASPHRLARQYR